MTLPAAYGSRRRVGNLVGALALAAWALCPAPGAAEPVIAALGDSLTQGYGLPEAEGFVPRLQAWLRANGAPEAVVLNAGVSGDTTAGGLARVDWTLTPEVDAVIVALGGNDVLRGIDPAESRRNLEGILAAIDARGLPALLAGVPAPANYGPEYRAALDAIYPELAAEHGAILYPNFLAAVIAAGPPASGSALMQADRIHPNAAGVEAIVAAIGPSVLELAARAAAAR